MDKLELYVAQVMYEECFLHPDNWKLSKSRRLRGIQEFFLLACLVHGGLGPPNYR